MTTRIPIVNIIFLYILHPPIKSREKRVDVQGILQNGLLLDNMYLLYVDITLKEIIK